MGFVQPDGSRVLRRGVHESAIATLGDTGGHRTHESGAQSLTTVCDIGADRADLGPAFGVQPLAGHGDQRPVPADAEVRAQLDGPRAERARTGALDQFAGSPARRPGRELLLPGRAPSLRSTSTSWTPPPTDSKAQPPVAARSRQRLRTSRPDPPARRRRPRPGDRGDRSNATNGEMSGWYRTARPTRSANRWCGPVNEFQAALSRIGSPSVGSWASR